MRSVYVMALYCLFMATAVCATAICGDGLPDLAPNFTADLSGNFRRENPRRAEICLNGVWKIALAEEITPATPEDKGAYGYVLVPSAWTNPGEFPITGNPAFKTGKWSGECTWQSRPLKDYNCAWYSREFRVPPEWQGRRIVLQLDRASMSAAVFLNGKPVGEQNERDDKFYDITDYLLPGGEANQLAVRVTAFLNEEVTSYLGGDNTVKTRQTANLRGITGDVWLRALPAKARVADVFVQPSVRKRSIVFTAELDNPGGLRGNVEIRAEVSERGGSAPIKTFTASGVALDGSGRQVVEFAGEWADPTLWETDSPHLYEVSVTVRKDAEILDQTLPQVFGFREVWLEGREIMLNGKPLRLYSFHACGHDAFVNAAAPNVKRLVGVMRSIGFNSIQLGSEGISRRGHTAQYYNDVLSLGDETGIPVIMPVPALYAYEWHSEQGRARWQAECASLIRRYRNHPSLIAYALNFNYLGYAGDLNPRLWGSDYMPPDNINDLGRKRSEAAESERIVRALDPGRLVYHHASGNYGDFITSNFYIGWPPIQELEDYPSLWSAQGVKPIIAVEIGLPVYNLDLNRAREGNYETTRHSEMLEAEYLAPHLGAEAFRLQSQRYLEILAAGATNEKLAGADKYNVYQPYTWGYNLQLHEPQTSGMAALRPRFLRSWRTYGFSGFSPNNPLYTELTGRSFEPWHGLSEFYDYADYTAPGPKPRGSHIPLAQDAKRTPAAEAMRDGLQSVLAYFGGCQKEGFSAKDHAYFAGESIDKQIVLVNDTRRDLELLAKWRLERADDHSVAATGEGKITAPAGRSTFHAISLTAPQAAQRTGYILRLALEGTGAQGITPTDFALEVFPRNPSKAGGKAYLFDPHGETRALLKQAEIDVEDAGERTDFEPGRPIIIGRDALKAGRLPLPILRAVSEKGATALFFEQSTLSPLGLRLHPRGVREVFPLQAQHPALSGLFAEDLRNWRGQSSLLEPYPVLPGEAPDVYPQEPYRWGNRGVVCSYMIEKPHLGAASPLAECEFGLNYTPLLDIREGKGRILLCQMEVTGRYGKDPAATLLTDNLLREAFRPVTAQPLTNVDYLATSGGIPELAASFAKNTGSNAGIILRSSGKLGDTDKSSLLKRVEEGATLILIGQEQMADLQWLPVKVTTKRQTWYKAEPVSAQPGVAGVSVADLFLKDKRKDILVTGGEGITLLAEPGVIAEVTHGKGRVILFAVDPAEYLEPKVSPERMTRIYTRLTRILSALVANSGGAFRPLSEKYAAGQKDGSIPLPEEWRFSTDAKNAGLKGKWQDPQFDDSGWRMLRVPGAWENQGVTETNPRFAEATRPYDGFAWYRCAVIIPEGMRGQPLQLLLGAIDDMDETFFNGEKIGGIGQENKEHWAAVRDYAIPEKLINYGGTNVIAVRVLDLRGHGGMMGKDPQIRTRSTDNYPYHDDKPPFNPYRLTRW